MEIRIGIAGLAHRGMWWIELMQRFPELRITAICDIASGARERALEAVRNPDDVAVYERYEDMLADENVDAVALVVRCKEQGLMAAQAIEAGKHVNSEVPAAHSIEDCWRLVLACERSDKIYHLAEQTRYWGFIEGWKSLVEEGRLGKILFAEGQYIGFYGTSMYFRDKHTSKNMSLEARIADPENVIPAWTYYHPPIHYLPHELSPILKVLDDRVVSVTAMSTDTPSAAFPQLDVPDLQVALMKTAKGTLLRLAVGFSFPTPHRDHHWYQFTGSAGCVEWRRSKRDSPKMWLADSQMGDMAEVDWNFQREDGDSAAMGSGHGDADYYAQRRFIDAVLHKKPAELDVYRAVETAAPAILAGDSIDNGSLPQNVPDFHPNSTRPAGQAPEKP